MLLFVLAYIGGVLTIASPCILPVLPFVFARADQPFFRRGLPMLLGMGLTFAIVATLAAVGGGWAVQANEYGRYVAIALLALFGVTLLFPELSDRLTRPWSRWAAACPNPPTAMRTPAVSGPPCCSESRLACSGRLAPGRCSASSSPERRCKAPTSRRPSC
jgi:cytochrome c biogenesis protein CcdA